MPDLDATATLGVETRGYRRGTLSTDSWDQYVIPVKDYITSYKGRANTFRIPGNAAVTHNLASIHNATGSTILINVNRIKVDMLSTAVKAVNIQSPIVRVYRVTVLPTGGTAVAKTAMDSALTSSSSVTLLQAASAHRTATTITATLPANSVLDEFQAPRVFTAVGYELMDTHTFFEGDTDITLRALEGLVVVAEDAVITTGNPATDWWSVMFDWEEYTRP